MKSVLRQKINPQRIHLRDARSYYAILFDDSNRKPICRLYFAIILVIVILSGCGFNYKKEIAPNYYVISVDEKSDLDISYKLYNGDYIGLLGGGIKEIFRFKSTLIAAKANDVSTREINCEWYIIPLHPKNVIDPTVGIIGPLDINSLKDQLNKKRLNVKLFRKIELDKKITKSCNLVDDSLHK